MADPTSCDPSTSSSCFFVSIKQSAGQNFEFEMAGQSSGYLAASLSKDTTAVWRTYLMLFFINVLHTVDSMVHACVFEDKA